jgi:molecular chaperone GrpE
MTEENEKQTEAPAEVETPAEGVSAGSSPTAEAPTAYELLEKLREENRQLTDQVLRKQAEMSNLKKRLAREKEDFLQFSAKQTVEALLPILDGFELALANEGGTEGYRQGVELIYQQLAGTLQRMGLEAVPARGRIFDPNVHEAVAVVESDQHADQEIIDELQKGYFFKGRLLRPARVRVAKHSASSEETVLNLDAQPE